MHKDIALNGIVTIWVFPTSPITAEHITVQNSYPNNNIITLSVDINLFILDLSLRVKSTTSYVFIKNRITNNPKAVAYTTNIGIIKLFGNLVSANLIISKSINILGINAQIE